ncbi:MAG: transposase, partial [bacterium]
MLGSEERGACFATYAVGLLAEGERKSMEPIAARACADAMQTDALHQRLQHMIANSPWSDNEVRLHSARYALAEIDKREPIVAWFIDDTGFLKQGKHSVGVQRCSHVEQVAARAHGFHHAPHLDLAQQHRRALVRDLVDPHPVLRPARDVQ